MRWHTPVTAIRVGPSFGARRIVRGFLWRPKTIGEDTRWLERARWEEKAVVPPLGTGTPRWVPTAWLSERPTSTCIEPDRPWARV